MSSRFALASSILTQDATVKAALELASAVKADPHVSLDFSSMTRIAPSWGAVLSNILASHALDAAKLDVDLASATVSDQLARAGMYFALARHPGLDWAHLNGPTKDALERWKKNWRMVEVEQPLFDYEGLQIGTESPEILGDSLVAFLNPDRAPRATAPDFQAAVVFPWLRELMRHEAAVAPDDELKLHRQVSRFTWELLDNVTEHALMRRTENCSLATFATRGRRNLLHLCVMDTGVGVPASLASRYARVGDVELVRRAILGDLPLRGPGRGDGLHGILKAVNKQSGARFFLASGPTEDGGSVIVDHEADNGDREPEVKHVRNLRMQGTVVLLTIPFGGQKSMDGTDLPSGGVRATRE